MLRNIRKAEEGHSEVKSTCCSSRGPELSSSTRIIWLTTACSYSSWAPTPSADLFGHRLASTHTDMQTHTYIQITPPPITLEVSAKCTLVPALLCSPLCLAALFCTLLLQYRLFQLLLISENTLLLILKLSLHYFLPTSSRIRACADESLSLNIPLWFPTVTRNGKLLWIRTLTWVLAMWLCE